jgi:7,8-dihydroneopterin aldolase/epimerase/oxygenase
MLKIELSNLLFHGFHGVHEEESKTGGDYEVDLCVYLEPRGIPVRHMDETIDYTLLYQLVKQRMERPTRLLETLATEIAQEILSTYQNAEEVSVKIKKLNPPIPFFNGNVSAEYNLKRAGRRIH